jgi:hypothetical protein
MKNILFPINYLTKLKIVPMLDGRGWEQTARLPPEYLFFKIFQKFINAIFIT